MTSEDNTSLELSYWDKLNANSTKGGIVGVVARTYIPTLPLAGIAGSIAGIVNSLAIYTGIYDDPKVLGSIKYKIAADIAILPIVLYIFLVIPYLVISGGVDGFEEGYRAGLNNKSPYWAGLTAGASPYWNGLIDCTRLVLGENTANYIEHTAYNSMDWLYSYTGATTTNIVDSAE